ncbi:MAG: hypothetical protein GC172_13380 [Phycisphaera sp.]|nr:hypothetical protein [Phycisphaera sp.]
MRVELPRTPAAGLARVGPPSFNSRNQMATLSSILGRVSFAVRRARARGPVAVLSAFAAAVVALLAPGAAHAQCEGRWLTGPEQLLNGPDSFVTTFATLPNGDLVVGGEFTTAGGVAANNIARWDGSSWHRLGSGIDEIVYALAVLPNGDLVAGGWFSTAGGVSANNIARWNGATWVPLGSGMNYAVRALAVLPNGDIVAGGDFSSANGVVANRIARWDGSSWSTLGAGLSAGPDNAFVFDLAVLPNGDLVAGGFFTTAGGVSANGIARWNGSSWSPIGSGFDGSVRALAVLPNGELVAGGGVVSANNIARWNGSSWSPLGSGMKGQVSSLAVLPNGDLVAGGSFTRAGGVVANRIARWDGSSWSPLGSGVSAGTSLTFVDALSVLSNGDLVAGGNFTAADGAEANNIARWNGSSWAPLSPASGLSSAVYAFAALPSGDLVMGGDFTAAAGVTVNRIARLNGSSWSPFGSGVSAGTAGTFVSALSVLSNGDLVAGGNFTAADGAKANNIARWDGSSWASLGSGVDSSVFALAELPNGDVVAGGFFTTAGGAAANRIARWDGSSWHELGSGMNDTVRALTVLPNGDIVAGGNFTTASGVVANRIARWDGSSWAPLGSGMNGTVRALTVLPNGDLVAGGKFTTVGGVAANNIARWNGSSWSPLGSGISDIVYALSVLPNGDLVAGGVFPLAGGAPANCIARWNGLSWSPLGSGISAASNDRFISAAAVLPNGELVAGGRFSTAGGVPSNYFARWTDTGIPWVAQQPAAQSIDAGATLTLAAACASGYDFDGAVSFQWQRNGVDIANGDSGASKGGGEVSGASGALTATVLSTTLTITDARPSDAGEYTVVFTNSCGAATSVAAAVAITTPCLADLTGDGLVGSADLGVLLNAWGTKGSPADLTGDGSVDSADLAALLSAWGACG